MPRSIPISFPLLWESKPIRRYRFLNADLSLYQSQCRSLNVWGCRWTSRCVTRWGESYLSVLAGVVCPVGGGESCWCWLWQAVAQMMPSRVEVHKRIVSVHDKIEYRQKLLYQHLSSLQILQTLIVFKLQLYHIFPIFYSGHLIPLKNSHITLAFIKPFFSTN